MQQTNGKTLAWAILSLCAALTCALVAIGFYAVKAPLDRLAREWQRDALLRQDRTPDNYPPVDTRPAESDPYNSVSWITADDYPAASLRANQQGTVRIGWSVGAQGRAFDCRILESSGYPRLDQAACKAILRRARYRPEPVGLSPRNYTRRVVWRLPDA